MSKVQKFRAIETGQEVEAVQISTADDARAVRADEAWHEGAVALLSFRRSGWVTVRRRTSG